MIRILSNPAGGPLPRLNGGGEAEPGQWYTSLTLYLRRHGTVTLSRLIDVGIFRRRQDRSRSG
jgi:hypothetical protein